MATGTAALDHPLVVVRDGIKSYPHKRGEPAIRVMDGIELEVGHNECVVIIGPSGCGKSTLLSCLAGLTDLTEGVMTIAGRPVTGPSEETAVVFQHASLMPWKTVRENVAFGLRLRRSTSKAELDARVARAIQTVGLSGFEEHYPYQISGGMQQRVNLARALICEAPLTLMDEPFGALDAQTKELMQDELARLMTDIRGATVFITHDIREAIYLADKVAVMSSRPGRIIRELKVPFPRPRMRSMTDTPEFEALVVELRNLLHG